MKKLFLMLTLAVGVMMFSPIAEAQVPTAQVECSRNPGKCWKSRIGGNGFSCCYFTGKLGHYCSGPACNDGPNDQ